MNKLFSRLDSLLLAKIKEKKLVGINTLIYYKNKIVYNKKFGYQDAGNRIPTASNTIYRIYSMTKPITCLAALILYEKGLLNLEDPVSQYIPSFKQLKVYAGESDDKIILEEMIKEPTIKDLFCHTAGLSYGFDPKNSVDRQYVKSIGSLFNAKKYSLKVFVDKVTKLPLLHQPQTKWHYSVAHDILGHVIEIISNKSLKAFLDDQIFVPLEMKDTDFYVPADKQSRFAKLYAFTNQQNGIKELLAESV